jgi:hypothetical protein
MPLCDMAERRFARASKNRAGHGFRRRDIVSQRRAVEKGY